MVEPTPPAGVKRQCPECSVLFEITSYQQTFCCRGHAKDYQACLERQGRAIVSLVKAWRAARNRAEDREFGSWCLSELSRYADAFNDEDRAVGRASPLVHARALKRDHRGTHLDRQRPRSR